MSNNLLLLAAVGAGLWYFTKKGKTTAAPARGGRDYGGERTQPIGERTQPRVEGFGRSSSNIAKIWNDNFPGTPLPPVAPSRRPGSVAGLQRPGPNATPAQIFEFHTGLTY